MARLLSVLVLLAGAGMATSSFWLEMLDDEFDYEAIYARSRRLEEAFRARKCFIENRDAALAAMTEGRMTLRQACADVRVAGEVFYPVYLEMIAQAHPQQDADECLARNLFGHLTMWVKDQDLPPHALPDLEWELEAWVGGLRSCPNAVDK